MKLQCEVGIVNRLITSSSVCGKTRPAKSTLALGQEPKNKNAYFILHFSNVNKHGVRYAVNGNIEKVFTKFCNEGKATIRFKNPPNDLCIKSDAVRLKSFLKVLKLVLEGNAEALKEFKLCNVSAAAEKSEPTKLSIAEVSKWPLRGLPRGLTVLRARGLALSAFRREILSLRSLATLDLSHNRLRKLPPELGSLPQLKELHLQGNSLGADLEWRWLEHPEMRNSLRFLDIGDNTLGPALPPNIVRLKKLVTLQLDNNCLQTLPPGINRMSALQYLSVSNNELRCLPGALLLLHLQQLDISGNGFLNAATACAPAPLSGARPLVQLAAATALRRALPYSRGALPLTLVALLDGAAGCAACGAPVPEAGEPGIQVLPLRSWFPSVTLDCALDSLVAFSCFSCSAACSRITVGRRF